MSKRDLVLGICFSAIALAGCSKIMSNVWTLVPISDKSAQYVCVDLLRNKALSPRDCKNLPMDIGGSSDDPGKGCIKNLETHILTCAQPLWANEPQWNGYQWIMPAEPKKSDRT
jgi:hypothetical protein